MILVSACLLGVNCKYNGGNNKNQKVIEFLKEKEFVMACPEELGELKTPRISCEIANESVEGVLKKKIKVMNKDSIDLTENFLNGAYKTLEIAKSKGVKTAILKAKSPSCGCGLVYDGTFNKKLILGNGVTTQILMDDGIEVITEDDI